MEPSPTHPGNSGAATSDPPEVVGLANGELNNNGGEVVRVESAPKFDLESYISNYTGRTKLARLYLIGVSSAHLGGEALKIAVAEAKKGKDVRLYEKMVHALSRVAPSEKEATVDHDWVAETTRVVKAETERFEHELKGYKNNLIKESIRMGNEDLGHHYYRIGDLTAASKAFARMRDYCTTNSQVASMYFSNIIIASDMGNWMTLQSNFQRLKSHPFKKEEESKNKAKMWAAMGLSQFALGSYYQAAQTFIDTEPSLGDSFKEVISPNDVAVYGGLCALASMDRNELLTRVLDNKSFRTYLELEPHIRRAISFFCSSKFRLCFDILEEYLSDYLLDLYLHKRVRKLYSRIRIKAMQQYVIPYSRVTLAGMAEVFSPDQPITNAAGTTDMSSPFITELISHIRDGVLDARIDMDKGVLVAKQTDLRSEVQQKAIDSAREYADAAHLQLLRIGVLNAGLEVPAPPKKRGSIDDQLAAAEPEEFVSASSSKPGRAELFS